MELYDSFRNDSYSTYSKFYSFKEIFFGDKCYKFSSLHVQPRKLGLFDVFLHEMNKFCKKKYCFVLQSECLCLKYIFIKVLLIYSQRYSLKYINFHFNLSQITPHLTLVTLLRLRDSQSDGMH